MTDMALLNSLGGGDIKIINGDSIPDNGLETAVFITLFGSDLRNEGFYGDAYSTFEAEKLNGDFQKLLSEPITSSNLLRLEDSAKKDLDWMIRDGLVSEIIVSIIVLGINKIKITIDFSEGSSFSFLWQAMKEQGGLNGT